MGTSVESDDLGIDLLIGVDGSAAVFVALGYTSDFSGTLNTHDDEDCLANFDAASSINCELNRR